MKTRHIVLGGKRRWLVQYSFDDRNDKRSPHGWLAVLWPNNGGGAGHTWKIDGVHYVVGKRASDGVWELWHSDDMSSIDLGRTLKESWVKLRLVYDGR